MNCPICESRQQEELFIMPDRLGLVPGEFRIVRCPECSGQYLDPMPDPDLKDPYFEQLWGTAGKSSGPLIRLEKIYKRMLDTLELLRIKRRLAPGARVLDIGCGDGDSLAILHRWGFECWGLDSSPAGVKAVRERIPIEARLGSIYQNDLPAGTFDLVLMSHVMEHMPEPARAAAEVNRLLKPGGLACIIVPNVDSIEQRLGGRHWYPYLPPRHVLFFTPKSLARLLERAGLQVMKRSFSWLKGGSFVASLAPRMNFLHDLRQSGATQLLVRVTYALLGIASVPISIAAIMAGHGSAIMIMARKPNR